MWILGLLSILLTGCATTIRPPHAVKDPVRVVVLDYGYHASLAVPEETGGVTEHAFGEWGWYVENRTGWWRAPGILFLPRQGALGRRRHDCGIDELADASGAVSTLEINVEREQVAQWQARMDAEWANATSRRPAVRNADHSMDFVETSDRYWIFNTCNAAVAGWLVELDCEVSGWSIDADFKLAEPRPEPSTSADTPP